MDKKARLVGEDKIFDLFAKDNFFTGLEEVQNDDFQFLNYNSYIEASLKTITKTCLRFQINLDCRVP